VVWLAGHAHLSCLDVRQRITVGVDTHSFSPTPPLSPAALPVRLLHSPVKCSQQLLGRLPPLLHSGQVLLPQVAAEHNLGTIVTQTPEQLKQQQQQDTAVGV
jgi:hypothetical protein